jgi:protein-arginine kinase activator protein McsA
MSWFICPECGASYSQSLETPGYGQCRVCYYDEEEKAMNDNWIEELEEQIVSHEADIEMFAMMYRFQKQRIMLLAGLANLPDGYEEEEADLRDRIDILNELEEEWFNENKSEWRIAKDRWGVHE